MNIIFFVGVNAQRTKFLSTHEFSGNRRLHLYANSTPPLLIAYERSESDININRVTALLVKLLSKEMQEIYPAVLQLYPADQILLCINTCCVSGNLFRSERISARY
jgi:hypothetical protein